MKIRILCFSLLIHLIALNNPIKAQTPLDEALNVKITDINGQFHSLFDYLENDQYVLLDFFSATCGPCTTLSPIMDTVYRHFNQNQERLVILSIDKGHDNSTITSFAANTGAHYPMASGMEGGGDIAYEIYEISYFPTLVLIAPDRSILSPYLEYRNYAQGIIDSINAYGISNVGIEETIYSNELSVFPNPAQNNIEIKATKTNEGLTKLQVYNNMGQLIKSEAIEDLPMQLSLSNWQKGIYYLRLSGNKQTAVTLKFLKQ